MLPLFLTIAIVRSDEVNCVVGISEILPTIIFETGAFCLYYRYPYEFSKIIFYSNMAFITLSNLKKGIFSIIIVGTNYCQDDDFFVFIVGVIVFIQTIITVINALLFVGYFYCSTDLTEKEDYKNFRRDMEGIISKNTFKENFDQFV